MSSSALQEEVSAGEMWRFAIASGAYFVSRGILEPVLPLFVVALGGSATGVGFIISSSAILPMLLAVWIGVLADRWGPRFTMLIASVIGTVTFVLYAFTPTIGMLFAVQILYGVAHPLRTIPMQTWVANGGASVYRNFGLYTFTQGMGQLIGPLLGGWLLDHSGGWLPGTYSEYTVTFLVAAFFVAISGLGHFTVSERRSGDGGGKPRNGSFWRDLLRVVGNRMMLIIIVLSTANWMGTALRRSFFPLFLNSAGFSPTAIGFLMSVFMLCSMAIRPLIDLLVQRVGSLRVQAFTFGIAALAVGIVPLVSGFVPLLILVSIWGVTHGLQAPMMMAMATQVVEPEVRGLGVGVRVTANRLGEGAGPMIYGLVTSGANIGASFATAAACLGGGLLAVLLLQPRVQAERSAPGD